MGAHKTNPTAIAAKKGEIPPKEKTRLTKRQREAIMRAMLYQAYREALDREKQRSNQRAKEIADELKTKED